MAGATAPQVGGAQMTNLGKTKQRIRNMVPAAATYHRRSGGDELFVPSWSYLRTAGDCMQPGCEVRVWEEAVVIPTYGVGEPDRNPMFLEKRVYQGSSGAVYPLPVIDKILDEKHDKIWNAVFLENRYLKIMILPELGGRVQM